MVVTHKHNPVLKNKLSAQTTSESAEGLNLLLDSLSVAEFRTAGYLLSEEILPQFSSQKFWNYFLYMVPLRPKAYLVTFMKAAVKLYRGGKLQIDTTALKAFAPKASPIDVRKMLELLLPEVQDANEIMLLTRIFCQGRLDLSAPHLLKAGTPAAYYRLFCLLKTVESDPDTLRHYVFLLMRKSDPLSFNMASIVCQYFGLEGIPGRFSLRLEPYELSRLDQGQDLFLKHLLR